MIRRMMLMLMLFLSFVTCIHDAQGQDTVMLTATVIIPLSYETPWGTHVDNDMETWYGMEKGIAALDTSVYSFTEGAADIEVTVEYIDLVTPDHYRYVEGYFVDSRLFPRDTDFVFVMTDSDAISTWYKGLTAYPESSAWVYGGAESDHYLLHELGHMIEILLNERGYYLQSCTELPASYVHCGEAYGFPNSHVMGWMEYFYQSIPFEAWSTLAS